MPLCSTFVTGWISIGSLDGILYSVSPDGDVRKLLQRTAPNSVIHASPVPDCSGFSVYVSQTIMEAKSSQTIADYTYVSATKPSSILFTLLAPATGTVYWTEKYPGLFLSLHECVVFSRQNCGLKLIIIWYPFCFQDNCQICCPVVTWTTLH